MLRGHGRVTCRDVGSSRDAGAGVLKVTGKGLSSQSSETVLVADTTTSDEDERSSLRGEGEVGEQNSFLTAGVVLFVISSIVDRCLLSALYIASRTLWTHCNIVSYHRV